MSEQICNRYRALFEIQLLHHYWLDEGATVFDSLPEDQQKKRLLSYDCRRFFIIEPTASTAKVLSGLGCIYKTTALGCVVVVPEKVTIPVKIMLEFVVTVRDPNLFNYTALTLRPQTIHEIYHKDEKKAYRYKENMPVLSNLTGSERNMGPEDNTEKTLFLSKELPTSVYEDDQAESLFIEKNTLKQLIEDQPDAASAVLYLRTTSVPTSPPSTMTLPTPANKLPCYVHQGDIPDITPPRNLSKKEKEKWKNVPKRGWLLSDDIPDDVFALIQLQARLNKEEFSLVNEEGQAKEKQKDEKIEPDNPIFDVRFKNRSTFWQYFDKKKGKDSSEDKPIEESKEPLPLTHFGNAGTKQKPSKGVLVKVTRKEKNKDKEIKKIVSEIYI